MAKDDNIARISIIGVPDKPGLAFKIFSKLASKGINVDIILQSIGRNGTKDISFTVDKNKMDDAIALLQQNTEKWGASNIVSDDQRHKGVHCGRRHGRPIPAWPRRCSRRCSPAA